MKFLLKSLALTAICGLGFNSCKKDQQETPENFSPFISQVFAYVPAPGQFVNDPSSGTAEKAKDLIGGVDNGLVSLGAYGGYIIFGFDHSIKNESGPDLGIFGNPVTINGAEWSEPGIVMVMEDTNKNGLPNDTWYEIAGSGHAATGTIKKYEITYYKPDKLQDDIKWTDNQGKSGFILRNAFHTQAYYPVWANEKASFTFNGTLLENTFKDGGVLSNKPFDFGYSDSGSAEYLRLQETRGRGYNAFDIDWAMTEQGEQANLKKIDFVKVYTGQNHNGSPVTDAANSTARVTGEVSTEVAGAVDIRLYNKFFSPIPQ